MTKAPPLLPAEILFRMLRLARRDGTGVLAIAGSLALVSAALGDYLGALVGVVIAGAGVFELHGVALLKARQPNGINWLVGSQIYLLMAVLAYVIWRLQAYDAEWVRRYLEPVIRSQEMQEKLQERGATEEDLLRGLRLLYFSAYAPVAVLTLFYQGGMALYYHRRRAAVAAALIEEVHGE
jgi:hypothetical protein